MTHLTDSFVKNAKPTTVKNKDSKRLGQPTQMEHPDDLCRGLRLIISPRRVDGELTLQAGVKSWEYRYRLDGRLRRIRLGQYPGVSLRDARNKWAAAKAKRDDGTDLLLEREEERSRKRVARERDAKKRTGSKFTVAKLVDKYVDHVSLKNRSWYQAKYYLERYVVPRYGKLSVQKMTRKKCFKVLDPIEDAGHIHDRNRTKAYAHAMWNWALEREKVTVNPWYGIRNLEEKARDHVITEKELRRIMRWLDSDECKMAPTARDALLFCFYCGTRIGETTSLRTEFVDGDVLTIPGALTKNGKEHVVYLSRQAQALIAPRLKGEYLFSSQQGPHYRADSVNGALRRQWNLEKVRPFIPHDCRTAMSTWLGENECPAEVNDRMLNHRASSVTNRHYNFAKLNKPSADWWQRWADHLASLAADNVVELKKEA